MHNTTFLVLKHEVKTTLARRSFWFTTFVFPLLILALTLIPQLLAGSALEASQQALLAPAAAGGGHPAIGYVDESGLVQQMPPDRPAAALLQRYPDEAAAQAALAGGALAQYYLVPADYLASGELAVVTSQFSPLIGPDSYSLMEEVLAYNLLGDAPLARLALAPGANATTELLAPEPQAQPLNRGSFGVSFGVLFILFFTITLSSGYMLQSVAREKENRTAEVLLLSLSPVQLMLGKILGLGLLALVQMGVWLGGGMALMDQGRQLLGATPAAALPPGFALLTALYFLLGYLLYASALGALGALAPNVREGSQFTFILLLPLLAPVMLNNVFWRDPNGLLATALSLFPLTAPTAMPTRLAAGAVPAWQPLLGLALLLVTAFGFVLLAARFFRADTLLSDAALDWRRVRGELRNG